MEAWVSAHSQYLGLSTQSVLWRWTRSCGRCLSHHALCFLDLKSLQLRPKCCLSCLLWVRDRGRAHSRSEWFLQPLCRISLISEFWCEFLCSELLHCFLATQTGQKVLGMAAHHPSLRTLWPSSVSSLGPFQFDDPEKVWAAPGLCTCKFLHLNCSCPAAAWTYPSPPEIHMKAAPSV